MSEFDDPLGKVAVDFGHRFANGQGGWLRLGIMLAVWLLTLGYVARGIVSAQEKMQDSLTQLSASMKGLAAEVSRLATANTELSEHLKYTDKSQEDTKYRVQRLEDGKKQ